MEKVMRLFRGLAWASVLSFAGAITTIALAFWNYAELSLAFGLASIALATLASRE